MSWAPANWISATDAAQFARPLGSDRVDRAATHLRQHRDVTVGLAQCDSDPVDFFAGRVDTVRLYDRALTAPEVAGLGS